MIRKEEMIPMLLGACPGFRQRWEEHVAFWNGEAAGVYNDMEEFVAYLLEAYKQGQTKCVQAAFDTLERFLIEGDPDTKERATIGFIEDVQNASSWEPFGAKAFLPYLKPHSKEAWSDIERFWENVIRAKESRGDSPLNMKLLWCWRCQAEMPMLDEDEYCHVMALRGTGKQGTIQEKIYGPVLAEYQRITGFHETNPNAIFHHRVSDYGPPCSNCGKPLRTLRRDSVRRAGRAVKTW